MDKRENKEKSAAAAACSATDRLRIVLTTVLFCGFLLIFFIWGLAEPDKSVSASERRPLEQFPELSLDTVMSGSFMSDFEDYSVDQFPIRDSFRTLKAVTGYYVLNQMDNNGVYLVDGQASKLEYPINDESLDYFAKRLQYIYDTYLSGKGTSNYLCIIPDKNEFIAAENGYPVIDFDEFESKVLAGSDYLEYIDIHDLLSADDYYGTDIHWRQENLADVAAAIAAGMGAPYNGEFETVTVDVPFYGVYYGQSALPLKADPLRYLTNASIEAATVYDYETNSEIPVHSMGNANGRDPYEMFLGGSKSLLVIENPDALSDKELVIFRDSFGSSLTPLLIESYSKITVVDIRYMMSNILGNFIEFDDQDVLFLYSMPVINNSNTMK